MPVLKVRDPNTGQYVPLLGGGVTDHGALTGLADDDHPQYVKDTGDQMTGVLYIRGTDSPLHIEGQGTATPATLLFKQTTGSTAQRWQMGKNGTAEAANDVGSDFYLASYDNNGAFKSTLMRAYRETGKVEFPHGGGLTIAGNVHIERTSPNLFLNNTDSGATYPQIVFRRLGVDRWMFRADGAETGVEGIGSDLQIVSRKNDGSLKHYALKIVRETGEVRTSMDPITSFGVATKQYVDTPQKTTWSPSSGWGDYGGAYAGLWVTESGGIVTLEGLIKRTGSNFTPSGGAAFQIGTVPAGYRPAHMVTAPCVVQSSNNYNVGAVNVDTAGVIDAQNLTGSGTINTGYAIMVNLSYRKA